MDTQLRGWKNDVSGEKPKPTYDQGRFERIKKELAAKIEGIIAGEPVAAARGKNT